VGIFNYFRKEVPVKTASTARDRLQVIVAHERSQRRQPDYLPRMQQEILEVIRNTSTLNRIKFLCRLTIQMIALCLN